MIIMIIMIKIIIIIVIVISIIIIIIIRLIIIIIMKMITNITITIERNERLLAAEVLRLVPEPGKEKEEIEAEKSS